MTMPYGMNTAPANVVDDSVQKLTEIIAQYVPVTILGDVVKDLGLVPDFNAHLHMAPSDLSKGHHHLANLSAIAASEREMVPAFASALYRRLWQDSELASLLVPFMEKRQSEQEARKAQQAALVLRAHVLRTPELRRWLMNWEKWICVVAARQPGGSLVLGTGVLVGPDLVMTAYHNVRTHIAKSQAVAPQPGDLVAIFDHLEGEPIRDLGALQPCCLSIPFHKDWLVASSEDMTGDGTFLRPDAKQEAELQQRLDFAVVRLARPVGRWSRNPATGSERRSWLSVVRPDSVLSHDDRIIIPQHPVGATQKVDFGRFMADATICDTSGTRLRYDTETSKGTSGAPCFNQNFRLVGVHNAAFQPAGEQIANQAVRLERILDYLHESGHGNLFGADQAPSAKMLWSVSAETRVILGRRSLIGWIEQAATETTDKRSERIYAAVCRGEGPRGTSGFGKTFSIDILRAARNGKGERVVVLGSEDRPLPTTVPDLLLSICEQLGIPATELSDMPARPSTDSSSGVGSTDKLLRWASEEVPIWFDTVLATHRYQAVDRKAKARAVIQSLEELNVDVPKDLRDLAEGPMEHKNADSRWDLLWIAVDRLTESRMSSDVRNLLAGLTGGKQAEASMPSELRRLRWLFLGYVPDFLSVDDVSSEVTAEMLDPMEIGADAVVATLEAQAAASDRPLDEQSANIARILFEAMNEAGMLNADIGDPNKRLGKLQSVFPYLESRIGGKRLP